MSEPVNIFWLEQGWIDHFPQEWFRNRKIRKGVKYHYSDTTKKDFKRLEAQCDVTARGNLVELDYRQYRLFNDPGGWKSERMQILFSDESRNCIAEIKWARRRISFDVSGPIEKDTLRSDVKDIENDRTLSDTVRQQLIAARRGQGKFRKNLDKRWEGACAVTGIKERTLLRGSHIKPWSQCSTRPERLSHENGILLTAHLDALFDSHLITFTPQGRIRIAKSVATDCKHLGITPRSTLLDNLTAPEKKYMRQHYELFERKQRDALTAGR